MNTPSKLSLTMYDKTISVDYDRSDLTLDELFEDFVGILITHTFTKESIDNYIQELASEIKEKQKMLIIGIIAIIIGIINFIVVHKYIETESLTENSSSLYAVGFILFNALIELISGIYIIFK